MGVMAVEIDGRGVTQTAYLKAASEIVGYAAMKDGKASISYDRYDDAPDRVGVPIKSFTVIGDTWEDLQAEAMLYEPREVDVILVSDPTMLKGTEPWAHIGLRPINEKLKPGGVIIVNSDKKPEELAKFIPNPGFSYKLATVNASAIDRIYILPMIGVMAKLRPDIASKESLEAVIRARYKAAAEVKAAAFLKGYEEFQVIDVPAGPKDERAPIPKFPTWQEMPIGLVVYAPKPSSTNPHFKTWSYRTYRPVTDPSKCNLCKLCWIYCPEPARVLSKDGKYYDVDLEYCKGCGVCAEVCPTKAITMVNELELWLKGG